MRTFALIPLMMILQFSLYAQVDSSLVFDKAKGTLSHPVKNFVECTSPHNNDSDAIGCPRYPANNYKLNAADTVRAIYEGRVVSIFIIGEIYCILIKFGDYLVSYSGLQKPFISKGDYVKRNQELAVLIPKDEGHYELELMIMNKKLQFIYPMLWITQTSTHSSLSD